MWPQSKIGPWQVFHIVQNHKYADYEEQGNALGQDKQRAHIIENGNLLCLSCIPVHLILSSRALLYHMND